MKRSLIVTLSAAGLFAACAHAPPRALTDARDAVERAKSGPTAGLSPGELSQAEYALQRAEKEYKEHGSTEAAADLAYVALRRAEVAESRARWRQAEATAAKARAQVRVQEQRQAEQLRREREQMTLSQLEQARQQQLRLEQQLAEQRAALDRQTSEAERQALQQGQQERERALEAERQAQAKRIAELEAQVDQERRARAEAEQRAQAVRSELEKLGEVREDQRGLVLTLPGNLMFSSGSSKLNARARGELDQLAEALNSLPESGITIEGHTDAQGRSEVNQELSFDRAQAVRLYLISQGVDPRSVEAVGYGELRPVAENDTASGRAENRRVEIVLEQERGVGGGGGTGGSGPSAPTQPSEPQQPPAEGDPSQGTPPPPTK
jgi:outer membrane protein OmpA-like peptidoglycan-associated protein